MVRRVRLGRHQYGCAFQYIVGQLTPDVFNSVVDLTWDRVYTLVLTEVLQGVK